MAADSEQVPLPPLSTPARGLKVSRMRCARHSDREAAARCPRCGGSFCRECVSEHEGRLLCAGCLAALALESAEASRPKARKSWLGPLLRNVLACFVGWLLFFLVCKLIVRIPHDFHDGVSAPTFEETW